MTSTRAGRRCRLAILVPAIAAAALAGCGSDSKLSGGQAEDFNSRARQFGESMATLESRSQACARKASSGDVDRVADCFAGVFDEISGNFEEISTYVAGLSRRVEGNCSAKLKTVSGSLGDVSEQFATAADDFRAGKVSNLDKKLNDRRLDRVEPELNAAERACT